MRELPIVLRYRLHAWWHGERSTARKSLNRLSIFGFVFFALVNLALSGLVFILLWTVLTTVTREILLHLVVYSLAGAAMVLAVASGLNVGLGCIYEAPHLPLVMSWPIGPRVLYAAGFVEVFGAALGAAGVFILPVWVGVALAIGAPPAFTIAGAAGLLGLTLLGCALGGLALCAVLSLVDAVRLRRFLVGALLVGVVALVLVLQTMSVQVMRYGWQDALARTQAFAARTWWLPHGLVAESVLAARDGRLRLCLGEIGIPIALGLSLSGACVLVGGATYNVCWSRAQETPGRTWFAVRPRRGGKPRPIWSYLGKDWLILVREPLFWVNLLVFMLGVAFYAWCAGQNAALARASQPVVQVTPFFLAAVLATGWQALAGGMGVSREGQAWWCVQAAPLGAGRILAAKLLFGGTGVLLLFFQAWLVFLLGGLAIPGAGILLSLVVGMTLSLTGAGLLADLVLPDFTLRLGVKMSGAYGGGKTKVLVAMIANFAITGAAAATFVLGQAAFGPVHAAVAVLSEGAVLMILACLLGRPLLDRLLVSAE